MAKDNERANAKIMYIDQRKDAKEISHILKVSEATLSKWVNKEGWKEQRDAKLTSPEVRTDNIKQVMNSLADDRLDLDKKLKAAERLEEGTVKIMLISELRKNIVQVDDAISKWNKTLLSVEKENKVSFSMYMLVMDKIFNALKNYDERLYLKTIDFQGDHLNEVAKEYR